MLYGTSFCAQQKTNQEYDRKKTDGKQVSVFSMYVTVIRKRGWNII
ncbi:MAG: hypothetical protein GX786_04620 [Clostridiales bacterium]|nr:hypothetical protein [Clostridiales bacterium]